MIPTPETINRMRELRRAAKKEHHIMILPQAYTTSDIDIAASELSHIIETHSRG